MRICGTVRHVFDSLGFGNKIRFMELLQMAAKLHTFKNNIYRAEAFSEVYKNQFQVFPNSKPYALIGGITNKSLQPSERAIEGLFSLNATTRVTIRIFSS